MSDEQIIFVYKTPRERWVSFAQTVMVVFGLPAVGVWLNSPAMQWIGGGLLMLWLVAAAQEGKNSRRCTIAEARARLDEIERGAP